MLTISKRYTLEEIFKISENQFNVSLLIGIDFEKFINTVQLYWVPTLKAPYPDQSEDLQPQQLGEILSEGASAYSAIPAFSRISYLKIINTKVEDIYIF